MTKQNQVVTANYQDLTVSFTDEGWFNATLVAEKYNKNPYEWLRLPTTKEYLAGLERKYGNIPHLKTRRGNAGGTWLHPKLAVRFAQWLDIDFAIWCDEQIDSIIRGNHPHFDWKRKLHEASSSFKVMNAVLQLTRKKQGKDTVAKHYMSETKLINWVLSGKFKSIDRGSLSLVELDFLAKLEEHNAVLVCSELSYDERKIALVNFANNWRAAHTPQLDHAHSISIQ